MELIELCELITIDDGEAVPKYKQLQSELERLIAGNVLKPNSRLPGENEFFSQLGLSRTTIRKALLELERAHLIYRVQGQGTFVGSKPTASEPGKNTPPGKFKKVIGVVLPNITNEIYPFIIRGIEQTAQAKHICVFSANSSGVRDREVRIVNEMLNNSVDGLVIEPLYPGAGDKDTRLVSLLESLTIPVVLINNDIPTFECSKVMQDDECGGRLITEHFLEHGHTRIAYIYHDGVSAAFERRKGYRAALAAAGVKHDPRLEIAYNDEQGIVYPGYVLTKQLLQKPELGVTGIFYFNDDLALQGLEAARSLNMDIPRDFSISGYDDIPRSRLAGVNLTTVSHPKALLGIMAASLIFDQFEQTPALGDKPIYQKITMHPSMLVRSTVGPPKRQAFSSHPFRFP